MKPKIEKPKIFISYAWGSREYQNKVLALANDLVSVGIDVLFDKWDLKEGHDTYVYMEKCVNDDTVTNVIILLDPIYEEKANERSGGVGTETQIISSEIYNNVSQEKFLPVVFEKKEDGTIPKPQYLKSLLHFDLSDPTTYDENYQRLVKRLYGVNIYQKPELGNIPNWVTEEETIPSGRIIKLEQLKNNNNYLSQKDDLISILDKLEDDVISFKSDEMNCIKIYEELKKYRDEYLQIIKYSHSIKDSNKFIYDFLEELCSRCNEYETIHRDEKKTLIHEMFIYTVAFYYKQKDYDSLSDLLCKTYFVTNPTTGQEGKGIHSFYSYYEKLDYTKRNKDNKKYYNGTAQIFVDSINVNICSLKDLCFADELCYNFYVFGSETISDRYWFPILYIYDGEYNTLLKQFSSKLKSSDWALTVAKIFGYENVQMFKDNLKKTVKALEDSRTNRERYLEAFRFAPQIVDFIKVDDIATSR